jgi:hypothetical protein
MPIPISEFETNPGKIEKDVLSLLKGRPELAYEAIEIGQTLSMQMKFTPDRFLADVGKVLDKLAAKGTLDMRMEGGTKYYYIHR